MKKNLRKLLALCVCLCLCINIVTPAIAVNEDNERGVTFGATLDKDVLQVSTEDQTVVMTVNSNIEFTTETIQCKVTWPNTISVTSVLNSDSRIDFSGCFNNTTGNLVWDGTDSADTLAGLTNVVVVTFVIPAGTPAGEYTFGVENITLSEDFTEWEMSASATTTLTITDPAGGEEPEQPEQPGATEPSFELYYILDDTDTDGYYEADPGATVTASIMLKSDKACTLQGYNFFILNDVNLTRGDITYTIGKGSLVNAGTTASSDTLTHIQYAGDELSQQMNAGEAIEIARIKYTVGTGVKHGDELAITINSQEKNAVVIDGESKSYNSTIGGDTLGVEITKMITVTFAAGEGTGTMDAQSIPYNTATELNANTFTKTGYTFASWKDVDDNTYTDSQSVTLIKDVALTAQWDAATYTLTFNVDAGSGEFTSIEVTYDDTYPELPTPTAPKGYTFAGWYADETLIKKDDTVAITGDTELTAEYEPITYTVKFDLNEGDGVAPGSVNATYDVAITLPEDPSRENYRFVGWNINKNAQTALAEYVNLASTQDAEVTLYAIWSLNAFEVTFVTNCDTNVDTQTVILGQKAIEPNVTKTGYTLDGWYYDGTKWDFGTNTVTEDITLTAQWTANTYTVQFAGNGAEGSMADQSFTYDEAATALSANTFTKTGYTFAGWKDDAGNAYTDKQAVQNLTDVANGVVTLTAQWTADTYTITYYINGFEEVGLTPATYTVEDTVTMPVPSKAFYSFDGWYIDAGFTGDKVTEITEGSTGNKTFYAQWTACYKLEDYVYARTGEKLLIIDADALSADMAPVIAGQQMYYTTDTNYGYDAAYLYIVGSDFDIGSITTEAKNEAYVIDKSKGDVNGDGETDLGDANAVYQMVARGGNYYTYNQVSVLGRLIADMQTESNPTNNRGNAYDALEIVKILNGVSAAN